MKKRTVLLFVIVGSFLALLLGLCLLLFSNQASTPDAIAKKVGLKLPAYQISNADDNMDRTASSWSDYYYEIVFDEPLSESFLRKVEKLENFTREGNTYKIEKESPDEWAGYITLFPEEN